MQPQPDASLKLDELMSTNPLFVKERILLLMVDRSYSSFLGFGKELGFPECGSVQERKRSTVFRKEICTSAGTVLYREQIWMGNWIVLTRWVRSRERLKLYQNRQWNSLILLHE